MKTILSFFFIAFLLFACAPPEQVEPTTTEPARPALTSIGAPPTETQAPTATATPIPTSTPDLSTITVDPKNFLLEFEDLPIVGKYYLPKDGLSPYRNSEIIQRLGTEKGEKYIQVTGRLDGWIVTYERGVRIQTIPQVIIDNISMFQTIEGAQLSINNDVGTLSSNYKEIVLPGTLGDFSRGFSYSRNNLVNYVYFFSYKNYVHILEFRGTENEVTLGFVDDIANKLLDKLVIARFTTNE
jgi:hypothetical protein